MSGSGENIAVRVNDLSKRFDVYPRPSDMLWELITGRKRHRECWALRHVTFDLHYGEVVGLVGRNGAGKSTLLRILTGTIEPTSGDVSIVGRVSSLLELGTGFHPEWSGRQNIYVGGLCRGMSRKEIEKKIDWIVDFSELEDFIEQPLKTYSTGMQARLAFSTAVCQEPEILIVDETLAVGDVRFQRKCFRQFEDFRNKGGAVLFVSHTTATIEAVCDRALYIRDGDIRCDGKPKVVTGLYLKDMFGSGVERAAQEEVPNPSQDQELRYGNMGATILDFGILDGEGSRVTRLNTGERYSLFCLVRCNREKLDDLNVGFSVHTVQGVRLFAMNPVLQRLRTPELSMGQVLDVRVDVTMWLAPGEYFMTFGAWGMYEESHYDRRVDALLFTVHGDPGLTQSLVNLCPRYHMSVLNGQVSPGGGQGS